MVGAEELATRFESTFEGLARFGAICKTARKRTGEAKCVWGPMGYAKMAADTTIRSLPSLAPRPDTTMATCRSLCSLLSLLLPYAVADVVSVVLFSLVSLSVPLLLYDAIVIASVVVKLSSR